MSPIRRFVAVRHRSISDVTVPPAQIEADLKQLARMSGCIRTYSVDHGQDRIAGIAAKLGLKVFQGLWLSSHSAENRLQIETAIRLANQYPDTIEALVVGNEVLLRGEMAASDLVTTIRAVKAQVKVPVTYADVWEFWLRNRDVAGAVDFITIHILPYWEDFPVAAQNAAAHVAAIRHRLMAAFPGQQIMIGEVGWPSAGRMRAGALPSLANQALVIQDVLALAKRENFKVNVIEAFDEPWKRALEGTAGGHWGLVDDASRRPKFVWGEAVSNHPHWKLQALGGTLFVAMVFGVAFAARRKKEIIAPPTWLAVTANALAGGVLIGWAIENALTESFGIGGWLRSLAFCAVAALSAPAFSAAIIRGNQIPPLSRIINSNSERRETLLLVLGVLVIALMLLAIEVAFGLVFDPRYKDLPFAPFMAATLPILAHRLTVRPQAARCGLAELVAASSLLLSALYIMPNEGLTNWQSLCLCTTFVGLAFTLVLARSAPS